MKPGMLTIGWASGEITPLRKTLVLGQFYTRISDTVASPLVATVWAIEAANDAGEAEQAVFISCDLASECFKPDLLQALQGRCAGLDLTKLIVNATHTHNAPSLVSGVYDEPEDDPDFMRPAEYRLWLAARIADLVETAWNTRQPSGVSRGFAYAMAGRSRRATYADGSSRMYGETNNADFRGFESCDDHAVNMLFTHDLAGDLTGIVVSVACPAQSEEHGVYFSADYWHHVREGVTARYGANVRILTMCAPAGDMSPHPQADTKEEADVYERLDTDRPRLIARRILTAIEEGMAGASPVETHLAFMHDVYFWEVSRLRVTPEEYALEKRIPFMTEDERKQQHYAFQRLWPFGPVCELISRYENQDAQPNHTVESHVIRLGDVAFATNPFELFVDYSMRIRCRSQARQTFLVQLACGSANGFYLPTQRALDGGHYSAQIKSCWVGPEGGDQLVEKTVTAINALFTNE